MSMIATKGPYILLLKDDDIMDSPRESEDNFGTMVCFHSRYNLGDLHDHDSHEDFLCKLVTDGVLADDVIAYVKAGKAKNVRFEYDRSTREWEINAYSEYFNKWYTKATFPAPIKGWETDASEAIAEFLDTGDLMNLLQDAYCILPLYLYDHSGLTMNTTGFSCPWDSGQVGWIYASKENIIKEFGGSGLTPENLEQAKRILEGEVERYDHYLRGECYGFELYKDGVEEHSCWGFIGDPDDLRDDIEGYLPEECKGIMNNLVYRYDDPDIEDILHEQDNEMEVF